MIHRNLRTSRAIYFPPVMAVAIAAAAISALPTLDRLADAGASWVLTAQHLACTPTPSGCTFADIGEPLKNFELVYGELDEPKVLGVAWTNDPFLDF